MYVHFSADELPIVRVEGYKISKEYLIENGFQVPILVDKKDGLDLIVPPPSFNIQDVENHVGVYALMKLYWNAVRLSFTTYKAKK